jgi:hypothetical protein
VTLNLKNWQTKVTNNFDTHVTFSLQNFTNKPPHSITTDEIPRWWWMMDTHFNNHTTSPVQLLHWRQGSNIGSCALSASDSRCFSTWATVLGQCLPVIQIAFLFTVAYYKVTSNEKSIDHKWWWKWKILSTLPYFWQQQHVPGSFDPHSRDWASN